MKKKVFFIVLVIPLINSCELDNRIIDFYNGCDEKLINYESISINIQTKDFNYPLETYLGKNINEYKHNLKSMLINTVHDSVVADIHPDEEGIAINLMQKGSANVIKSLQELYGIDFNVPLDTEIKIGENWLNLS